MANAWKRDKSPKLLSARSLLIICSTSLLLLTLFFLLSRPSSPSPATDSTTLRVQNRFPFSKIPPFDCSSSPQAHPVIANLVEGLKYPFLYSLSDFGALPDKPHKNIVRLLKGKLFRKPDISVTMQEVLERLRGEGKDGLVVDVGANVGMASFAAAVMDFRAPCLELNSRERKSRERGSRERERERERS